MSLHHALFASLDLWQELWRWSSLVHLHAGAHRISLAQTFPFALWVCLKIDYPIPSHSIPFHPMVASSFSPIKHIKTTIHWGCQAQLAADGHGLLLLPAVGAALHIADAQGWILIDWELPIASSQNHVQLEMESSFLLKFTDFDGEICLMVEIPHSLHVFFPRWPSGGSGVASWSKFTTSERKV